MIIKEITTEAQPVSLNGQPPQNMRQKLEGHFVEDNKSMVEFMETMAKGRDIVTQLEAKGGTYVLTREFIPAAIETKSPKLIV